MVGWGNCFDSGQSEVGHFSGGKAAQELLTDLDEVKWREEMTPLSVIFGGTLQRHAES